MNAIWGFKETVNLKDRVVQLILKYIQKFILSRADHLIVHSVESEKFVLHNFDVSKDKITIVTNAVNEKEIKTKNTGLKNNNPKKYLCIGFFDEMNGIPFLINFVRNKFQSIDITFFGSGPWDYQVKALESEGKCKYGGTLSRKEMMVKFSEFDYIIIPRLRKTEADLFIPTKLIEAMAVGLIPICSDVKGMTEVVKNDFNGIVFTAGDSEAFASALDLAEKQSVEKYKQLSASAIETVKSNYNWKANHVVLKQLYKTLLNQG